MRLALLPALLLGLFTLCVPRAADSVESEVAEAKAHLKEYLKVLNRQYPFPEWEKQLDKARKSVDKARERAAAAGLFARPVFHPEAPCPRTSPPWASARTR